MSTAGTQIAADKKSRTPILDFEEPLPRPVAEKRNRVALLVVGGVAALIVVLLVLLYRDPNSAASRIISRGFNDADRFSDWFFGPLATAQNTASLYRPIFLYVAFYFAIVLHECGHLVAGWAMRFRFVSFTVWPISVIRTKSGSCIKFVKEVPIFGFVGMLPSQRPGRRAEALFIAGGPLANLLIFAIVNFLVTSESDIAFVAQKIGTWSLFLGIANLIPFETGGFQSDGARLLMTVGNDAKFDRWAALIELSRSVNEGTKPRELDTSLLSRATSLDDESGDCLHAHLLAYAHAASQERREMAEQHLEHCLRLIGRLNPFGRAQLMFSAATFQGWHRENAEKARRWFELAGKMGERLSRVEPYRRFYPEIAIAWAECRYSDADKKAAEALVAIQKMPNTGVRQLLINDVTEWRAKMQKKLNERSATHPA